jgi:23S rRNA (uridine2552-2'-O)-methyltransferase
MSDMAPNTSGHRFTDHTRQIALVDQALVVAVAALRVGGSFVAKVFEGEEAKGLEERVKAHFAEVKRVKPKATRSESVELFLVATRKRAAEAAPRPQA